MLGIGIARCPFTNSQFRERMQINLIELKSFNRDSIIAKRGEKWRLTNAPQESQEVFLEEVIFELGFGESK